MLSRIIHTEVHEKLPASVLAASMNTLKLKVTLRSLVEKLELVTRDETAIHILSLPHLPPRSIPCFLCGRSKVSLLLNVLSY